MKVEGKCSCCHKSAEVGLNGTMFCLECFSKELGEVCKIMDRFVGGRRLSPTGGGE